jgi:hypothetical protein
MFNSPKISNFENNLTSGCHGINKTGNFSISPICFSTGEACKNVETGFTRRSPVCPYWKQLVAKDKISISSEGEFFKILAFKRTR